MENYKERHNSFLKIAMLLYIFLEATWVMASEGTEDIAFS